MIMKYVYSGIAVLILIMGTYIYFLKNENDFLSRENTNLILIAEQKESAVKLCSDNTNILIEAEITKTANAQKALDDAKKEADEWRKKATTTIFKKPKPPVITDGNMNEYGGSNKEAQLKDYLETQQLINEEIDERGIK